MKVIAPVCLVFFCSFNQQQSTEYKLKAAFLYNFIQYIEWDPQTTGNEYIIGILGSSPISQPLEDIAHLKSVNGKKIVIKYFSSSDEIEFCHILFIPQNSTVPLSAIMSKLPRGTLTVSEREGYALKGVAINFIIIDNKLKFECNLRAISAAGLKASSQLLKLAIIVAGS